VKEANMKRLHTVANYMTFWKRQNDEDSKKISGCQRKGWENKEEKH